MRFVINDQVVLSRAPDGPLAAYISAFAKSRSVQGYAPYSIHRQVLLAACFSHWLKKTGVPLRCIGPNHPLQYLRYRARRLRPVAGDIAALRHLIDFLRREGAIAAEEVLPPELTPVERCAQAYEQYLAEARALAKATMLNYVPLIRGFLKDRFGEGPVRLSRLTASDVVGFVQRQVPHLHLKRAKLLTTALRSFLRWFRQL